MPLSTETHGFIIDPLFSFMDDKGKTIKNGFVRVFLAGSSTPAVTYLNWNGAMNQETIQLDNSGRVATAVIGPKDRLYKVCVYDSHHSQETPILTVDNVQVLGTVMAILDGSVTTSKLADEAVTSAKIYEGAVTLTKLAPNLISYVTPLMYGATADGVADDMTAFEECFSIGKPIDLAGRTYRITPTTSSLKIKQDIYIKNGSIIIDSVPDRQQVIFESLSVDQVKNYSFENVTFKSTKDQTCHLTNTFDSLCSNVWLFHLNYGERICVKGCNFIDVDIGFKVDTPCEFVVYDSEFVNNVQSIEKFGRSLKVFNSTFTQDLNSNTLYHCIYEHGVSEANEDTEVFIKDCYFNGRSYPVHGYSFNNDITRKMEIVGTTIEASNVFFINTGTNSETKFHGCTIKSKNVPVYGYSLNTTMVGCSINITGLSGVNAGSGSHFKAIGCHFTGVFEEFADYTQIDDSVIEFTYFGTSKGCNKLAFCNCRIKNVSETPDYLHITSVLLLSFVNCVIEMKARFISLNDSSPVVIENSVLYADPVGVADWIACDHSSLVYTP